jgi:hypothetical protein
MPELSAEAAQMLQNFKAIDPNRQGVGLDKIRPFYPRVGWTQILAPVNELESSGLLSKTSVLNDRGAVGYHVYAWKEA